MSHIYTPTGVGAYVGAYTMPDDGDPRNAAAFNVPMEGMAEDVMRVKSLLDNGTINAPVVKHFPFMLTPNTNGDFVRTYNILLQTLYWDQATHTVVRYLEAPIDLPNGFEISQIQVWLDPKIGRANLPTIRPGFWLHQQNNQTGSSANLGSASDTSATLAAYETQHAITLNFSPVHVVNRSQWSYSVIFTGESGTNAQSGSDIYSVKVTGTAKKVL